MDYVVHGILQARILAFPKASFQPRDWTQVSCIAGGFFLPAEPQRKPKNTEWVAYHFSRVSSWPSNQTGVSCIAGRFFTNWTRREAHIPWKLFMFACVTSLLVGELINFITALSVLWLAPLQREKAAHGGRSNPASDTFHPEPWLFAS